jgi:hypothetical protein
MAPPTADAYPTPKTIDILADLSPWAGFQVSSNTPEAWDEYKSFDLTSAIGREFSTLQLSEILHDDAKIRDLGIIGPDFFCDESKI